MRNSLRRATRATRFFALAGAILTLGATSSWSAGTGGACSVALAFSNPLFIDANQNAQYDPQGVVLAP